VAQNFLWSSGTSYCGIGAPIESLWYSYRSFASTKQLSVTTCTGLPEQDVEIDTRLSVFTIDEDDCSGIYTCLEWNDHIDQPSSDCFGAASITWTAYTGVYYVIAVSTVSSDAGKFHLVLRES
jgi:hypothetical protein